MATNLRGTVLVQLGWTWRDTNGANVVTNSNRLALNQDLENGTGVNQADAVWDAVDQNLTAGSSVTLSLDALARDLFGDSITLALAKVKALLIVNRNTSGSGYLLLGAAASDEWYAPLGGAGERVKIMPGAALMLASPQAGWDVSAGVTDLKLAAVTDNVTFDVAILGIAATS